MSIKPKDLYEAPATSVFEVKTEGVICESTLSVMWINSTEIDWGRSSYGDASGANTQTWD